MFPIGCFFCVFSCKAPRALSIAGVLFCLFALAGCAPRAQTDLPGSEFVRAVQNRMAQPKDAKTDAATGMPPLPDKPALTGQPRPAYINIAALAARHPAWQLAESLEKSSGQTLRFAAIEAPHAPRALLIQEFNRAPLEPLENALGRLPRPARASGEEGEFTTGSSGTGSSGTGSSGVGSSGVASGYQRPPQRVAAREALALEIQGRERQEGVLESFLQDVARRQDALRADEKMRLRAELEDEIEASQRLALAGLEPLLPPPAVQLEMTNLRIALLPNAPGTREEKDRARERLQFLEAQWVAQLREQAEQRFEELRRLLTEVPLEKRQAGQKDIETLLAERTLQDENLRQLVEDSLRQRVQAGFGSDDLSPLAIQLPGAGLPAQTLPTLLANQPGPVPFPLAPSYSAPYGTNQIFQQRNSNTRGFWPSASAFADKPATQIANNRRLVGDVPPRSAPPVTTLQTRVADLRRQAYQDANRWAKAIARRQHWKLQSSKAPNQGATPVPDRTGEALQLLNL